MSEDARQRPVECHDCGRAYGGIGWMDASLSNEDWAKISPSGDENGILCISCMAARCERLGLKDVPIRIVSGPFVSPTESAIFDRGWKLGHAVATQEAKDRGVAQR